MAIYQRGAGAHVAERVQAEPGSDEEKRLERLVEDSSSGWRRLDADVAKGSEGSSGGDAPKQPAKSASQAAWVEWAVSQGADREAVKDAKRDDLVAQYGKE